MKNLYAGKIAQWCAPSELVIVPALPHTATGKLLKTAIRQMVVQPAQSPV